jgi:hypothetical protein
MSPVASMLSSIPVLSPLIALVCPLAPADIAPITVVRLCPVPALISKAASNDLCANSTDPVTFNNV